jgi:hypothetical protein
LNTWLKKGVSNCGEGGESFPTAKRKIQPAISRKIPKNMRQTDAWHVIMVGISFGGALR